MIASLPEAVTASTVPLLNVKLDVARASSVTSSLNVTLIVVGLIALNSRQVV